MVTKQAKECPKCKGKGYLMEVLELHGMPHVMSVACSECCGTGKYPPEQTYSKSNGDNGEIHCD